MNDASEERPFEEVLEEVKEKAARVVELLNEPNLPLLANVDEEAKADEPGSGSGA
jgi:hypothetical protein